MRVSMFTFSNSLAALLAACGGRDAQPGSDTTAVTVAPAGAEKVATAEGFSTPESVIYDADQRVWFVTNINGSPSAKDGNGFISRLTGDGAVDSLHFVQGGRDGVTLHAPKGQAIAGDTLWVTDIDAVRGFDRKTGARLATIEFGRRALFLNDIVVGPDGALYITDTGIIIADSMTHPGPDRIFRAQGKNISVVAEGDHLQGPNGIAWDRAGERFIMAPFAGTTIFTWKHGGGVMPLGLGPGGHDGVEVLGGRILVSSWADSTISAIGAGGTEKLITGVERPADIGLDVVGRRVAVPLFSANRVEIWRIP